MMRYRKPLLVCAGIVGVAIGSAAAASASADPSPHVAHSGFVDFHATPAADGGPARGTFVVTTETDVLIIPHDEATLSPASIAGLIAAAGKPRVGPASADSHLNVVVLDADGNVVDVQH